MQIVTSRVDIHTLEGVSIHDLSLDLERFVAGSGIKQGLCVLSLSQPSCCLALAEDLEESYEDVIRAARAVLVGGPAPPGPDDRLDESVEGYATPIVLADSLTLAVGDGRLGVGSWRTIVLVEGHGGNIRNLDITVVGE